MDQENLKFKIEITTINGTQYFKLTTKRAKTEYELVLTVAEKWKFLLRHLEGSMMYDLHISKTSDPNHIKGKVLYSYKLLIKEIISYLDKSHRDDPEVVNYDKNQLIAFLNPLLHSQNLIDYTMEDEINNLISAAFADGKIPMPDYNNPNVVASGYTFTRNPKLLIIIGNNVADCVDMNVYDDGFSYYYNDKLHYIKWKEFEDKYGGRRNYVICRIHFKVVLDIFMITLDMNNKMSYTV